MSTNIRVQKTCEFCGSEFTAKTLVTRYCSYDCNKKHYKIRARKKKIEEFEINQRNETSDNKKENSSGSLKEREFFSISEAAEYIGVSKRTMERLIASKKVPSTHINRRVIISKNNIDSLFKG